MMHYQLSRTIEDLLKGTREVLAISHANPDADSIASLLAFERAFGSSDRKITMAMGPGTVPGSLQYLDNLQSIQPLDAIDASSFDVIVFLDSADEHRVGNLGVSVIEDAHEETPVINIDHHVTNTNYGTVNLIDPEAAATCETLALLFEDLNITVDSELATILLTGIQGDTLGMRTPSTTSRTMIIAAKLLDAGADLHTIVDFMFRVRPHSTLKLWGLAVANSEMIGKLIWTEITDEMLRQAGADESEGEGIVNFLCGTIEANAAALLYRKPDGWRVSMRSRRDDIDVAVLAGIFGGGGHSRAAGCSLFGGDDVRDAFLNTISEKVSSLSTASLTGD